MSYYPTIHSIKTSCHKHLRASLCILLLTVHLLPSAMLKRNVGLCIHAINSWVRNGCRLSQFLRRTGVFFGLLTVMQHAIGGQEFPTPKSLDYSRYIEDVVVSLGFFLGGCIFMSDNVNINKSHFQLRNTS